MLLRSDYEQPPLEINKERITKQDFIDAGGMEWLIMLSVILAMFFGIV